MKDCTSELKCLVQWGWSVIQWRGGGVHNDFGGSVDTAMVEDPQQGWETGTDDLFLFRGCAGSKPDSVGQNTVRDAPV